MNNLKAVLLLLSLTVFLAGCYFHRTTRPPADYYYINPDADLSDIGRVALVEFSNESTYPKVSIDVTESLFETLQKNQTFGLTIIRLHDPAWRSAQLDPNSGFQTQDSPAGARAKYTLKQLYAMRTTLNCDTVILGTVTIFKPYPHMAIGLRLKLIDLNNGRLLWAVEQIWDTADKTTEARIAKYFKRQLRPGYAPLQEQLVAVSSLKFIKFVAYEVAETLQPERQDGKRYVIGQKITQL